MRRKKIWLWLLLWSMVESVWGQDSEIVREWLDHPDMRYASFGCMVHEVGSETPLCVYAPDLQVTPASVMKLVTTATALELLGEDYRFPTELLYDGFIRDSILHGNLYIKGHGDPTLGSAYFAPESKDFVAQWVKAIRDKGIRRIEGAIISDESLFDTEGVSMKWLREDLGSYYGAGSYALNVFDNLYSLYVRSGAAGTRPRLLQTSPAQEIQFHNYLRAAAVRTDSTFIVGMPFAEERYLYGVVPAHRDSYRLKGDIPEPALFLARYFREILNKQGISVRDASSCHRLLQVQGKWEIAPRTELITTYSPTLEKIVAKTNHVSHNLYADALLKTLGLRYAKRKGEEISSFARGVSIVRSYWEKKGLDVSPLYMVDGSGLSPVNQVTARFLTDLLTYMATSSSHRAAFLHSLPEAGKEGSVRNFLREKAWTGEVRLKSGSMGRVRCYAGYVRQVTKQYAVVLLVNNYEGNSWALNRRLERLLQSLFSQ